MPQPDDRVQHGQPPLAGVRVIELGSLIAGPFAGRLLADFGAEVIKVESPDRPDPLRTWGNAQHRGHTLWWSVQSRNKKCVTLDIRTGRGRELLLRLAAESDVLVENMRPGTLERLGLSPEALWKRNDRLIIARVSGFGQDGPYARRAGYASVAEAMGGLRYLNGYAGQPPPRSGISLGDSLGSLFALNGILMALYARDVAGCTGQVVDVSLVESCFAMLEGIATEYAATGAVRGPAGPRLAGIAPSNIFRCADGRWVVIAANQDSVFRRLTAVMGCPELADDPRFADHQARGRHQDEIEKIVAEWAARHESGEVDAVLNEAGVACGPINTIADIIADPLATGREMTVTAEDPELGELTLPGVVPKLSRTPGRITWTGPLRPGAHNDEVFTGLLGLSAGEMAELAREGVV